MKREATSLDDRAGSEKDGQVSASATGTLSRDIFLSGEYTVYFRPEEERHPFRRIYARKLADVISAVEAADPNSVLDLGGGMGRLSIPLARKKGRRVVLADLSSAMLRKAEHRAGQGRLPERVNTDAGVLPFADDSFDCITALDLLCHLPDPDRALAEIRRVLRPDGILMMDNTNSNPWWVPFYPRYVGWSPAKLFSTMRYGGVLPPWKDIVKHYRYAEFIEILERNGFVTTQTMSYGPKPCPKWQLAIARTQGATT